MFWFLVMLYSLISTFATAKSNHKVAYVTFVSTDDFVLPALVMGLSLKVHTSNSGAEYVCLVLEADGKSGHGISKEQRKKLESSGIWKVKDIPSEIVNPNYSSDMNIYQSQTHVWTYNKLSIWGLTEYEKVVYLDSDILVLQNISHLFELDIWTDTAKSANKTHQNFAAAPDMVPSHFFNSGVMVLRPDINTSKDMIKSMKRIESLDKGDQGFLNAYFSDWYSMPVSSRLTPLYNAPYTWTSYAPLWEKLRKDIKILHFYGSVNKPWKILNNAGNTQVPVHAMNLLYLWAGLQFLVSRQVMTNVETHARFLLLEVFDITSSDDKRLLNYIQTVLTETNNAPDKYKEDL